MLKTIVKHAKSHRRIPILGTICSRNGVATSTNLDLWISAPTDLPEGTYHPLGLIKGYSISADLPVTDFPVFEDGTNKIATVIIDAPLHSALTWVTLASSKEEIRYYLNGVYFDWKESQGRAVATDGHRLHSIVVSALNAERPKKSKKRDKDTKKYRDTTPEAGAIMPIRAIKAILDLMAEQPGETATIDIFENNKFSAVIGDALVQGKMIDGTFPVWRRVIPQDYAEKDKVNFDPAEIKAILPELQIICRIVNKKHPDIKIQKGVISTKTFGKDKEWLCSIDWDMPAGFNARYMSEICAGVMQYKDPSSPFKVTDRRGGVEKLAVLMPLRV